jgi:hypothetical protein
MYCPECGNEIRSDLKFCSRCGSQVERSTPENRSVAQNLSNALGAVAVFGILGFIAMLWVLLRNDFIWAGGTWICLFYLATVFGISSMIVKQIAALTGTQRSRLRELSEIRRSNQLPSPSTAQLREAREPAASVADYTTRTLGEVGARENSLCTAHHAETR